tara:strand:+ start:651 stop:1361 length:711 start_codon:yes stop_codon:yes gene_type:complete
VTKIDWLNYWDKKNIWTESSLWKKNNDIFFKKTSKILNYNKEDIVLDVGCGNGDFANKVLYKVNQVFCLDTSQEYINICNSRFKNAKNVKVFKLNHNYTDLSFLETNSKFSIIMANSVVQYYRTQEEIIDLVKSVKKISKQNALFLISDIETLNSKKSYIKLIYQSVIEGYFFSLAKMGFRLFLSDEYSKTEKSQPVLKVDFNKLIIDLSQLVRKVRILEENITVNANRKHLLLEL